MRLTLAVLVLLVLSCVEGEGCPDNAKCAAPYAGSGGSGGSGGHAGSGGGAGGPGGGGGG